MIGRIYRNWRTGQEGTLKNVEKGSNMVDVYSLESEDGTPLSGECNDFDIIATPEEAASLKNKVSNHLREGERISQIDRFLED